MKTSWFQKGFVILAILFALGGCASAPGQFNGLGNDVMTKMFVVRTDDEPITRLQYDAVVNLAKKMGERIGVQISSPFEAGVASGVAQAIAGRFDSSGLAYGIVGIIGGVATYSYAMIIAVAEATELAIRDEVDDGGQKYLKRIHVIPAFVRSKNTEQVLAR